MNKVLITIIVVIFSLPALIFILMFVANISSNFCSGDNMRYLDQPGDSLTVKCFKVDDVINDSCAIAYGAEYLKSINKYSSNFDIKVLLTNDEGKLYYDNQIVEVPEGMHARQIGIYNGFNSTLPIVKIIK